MHNVIIAPHPDDEIIGCYSLLKECVSEGIRVSVFFMSGDVDSFATSAGRFQFNFFYPPKVSGALEAFLAQSEENIRVYCPDPIYETHPQHRRWGSHIEAMWRKGLIKEIVFYSTNMQAPYIFEIDNPEEKLNALNDCYPQKADLWKYDHRYYLFEGYCSWWSPIGV